MATTVEPQTAPAANGDDILAEKTNGLSLEPKTEPTTISEKTEIKPEAQPLTEADAEKKPTAETTTASTAPTTQEKATEAAPVPIGPVKLPIPHPLPQCKPAPHPELTPEQTKKYQEVLQTVSEWTEVPDTLAKNSAKSALTDDERMFLTRDCILRYLRATKWNVANAITRLQQTLSWRREYGANKFTKDYIEPEQTTGKQFVFGFDNEGRPCLYLDPSRQNTTVSDRQVHHLVYTLDKITTIMPPGQETLALIVNFKNSTSSQNPGVGTAKKVLYILQNHYPERLGRALIIHTPWYVTTFFKLISPFIDPVTRTKLVFNEPLDKHVPAAQLQKSYGGEADTEYDHDVYWPAINALYEQRIEQYRERWIARGKKIGDDEAALKGAEDKGEVAAAAAAA